MRSSDSYRPTEHHVYLSIFGIILTSTYIVTTFYTQEHRRVRIRCSNHKQFFTPVCFFLLTFPYVGTSPFVVQKFEIVLFPCFCPVHVNLFLISNVYFCPFCCPMYGCFNFLLAVVIALLHHCKICSRALLRVVLRVFICLHVFICL